MTAIALVSVLGDPIRTSLLSRLALLYRQLSPREPLTLCLDGPLTAADQIACEGMDAADLVGRLLGRCGFNSVSALPGDPERSLYPNPEADNHGLLQCERSSQAPRWTLTQLGECDFPSFSGLFADVFGHSISLALWRWKYADGRGCAVAAWRDNELVAHYGGSLRRIMAFGHPISALQVCDAMVAPRERAVMTKTGAMYQVTAAFLELYQGLVGIPLAFGFPNRRAMRLGERLGFYAEVGSLRELRWSAKGRWPRLDTRIRFLNGGDGDDRRVVGQLWEAMAADLADGLAGVRDWEFLRRRYIDHPERDYRLVLVRKRLTAAPLGVLILHREEGALALIDFVGPLRNIPQVVAQARRLAQLWGCASLYTWITGQHVHRFDAPDMEERDIEVSIPTNIWVPQPFSPKQLRARWWLMQGDTDFL